MKLSIDRPILCGLSLVITLALSAPVSAMKHGQEEWEFGANAIIIELTDNDIELQVFIDGFDYTKVSGFDPLGEKFVEMKTKGRLSATGGFSEIFFASEPSHYLEEEDDYDESVEDFLARWPEGEYEFEGSGPGGIRLEGEATLTHVLPDLPVILAPLPVGDEPPVFAPGDELIISWEPVTTCFEGVVCDIEIFEYQVIIDQVEPERDDPWVDGDTRRALINLPPDITQVTVSEEFLMPGVYEFEILAIEASGNSTISVGEFDIEDE